MGTTLKTVPSELLPIFKEIVYYLKGPTLVSRKESATRPAVKHTGEHAVLWPEPVPGVPTSGVQSAPFGP